MTRPYFRADGPIAFAHRGGASLWPENTMAAFAGAHALGVRWMETDCHRTRDGHVVLHHDATVDRTTDGSGRVAAHTLEELRRLDAGVHFDGVRGREDLGPHTIPTLEELLDLGEDVRVNLELKSTDLRLARRVLEIADAHGVHDRLLVAAADHDTMVQFRALNRDRVATSATRREISKFVLASKLGRIPGGSIAYDALQVPDRHGPVQVISRRFLNAARDRGVHVHVWTIDDPIRMRALVDLGAGGIMSDRPDFLIDAVGSGVPSRAT